MEDQIPVVTNWGDTLPPPSQYCQYGNTAWCNEWNNVRHINTWYDAQSTVPMMHVDYTLGHGHYNQEVDLVMDIPRMEQNNMGLVQSNDHYQQWMEMQNNCHSAHPADYTEVSNWPIFSPKKFSLPPSPTCGENAMPYEVYDEDHSPFIDHKNLNLLADEVLSHSNINYTPMVHKKSIDCNQMLESINGGHCDTSVSDSKVTTKLKKKKNPADSRKRISDLIKQLNDMLPYASCHHLRTPRITTLKKAAEFIEFLQQEIQHFKAQLESIQLKRSGEDSTNHLLDMKWPKYKMSSFQTTPCRANFENVISSPQISDFPSSVKENHSSPSPEYDAVARSSPYIANVDSHKGDVCRNYSIKTEEENGVKKACDYLTRLMQSCAPGEEMNNMVDSEHVCLHEHRKPERIKKSMNAFMYFAKLNRTKLHRTYRSFNNREISKLLGQAWKNLSDNYKREYREMARQAREIIMSENIHTL
ncbi:uncharacterized protein LOC130612631 [Hydractinia symbiolongicarpus]|uniref:uncharacterized protein LOC130612631 n=1 Tax=Hydractinia symbiolongicarpus TaxID=13093 RepID=UPI0025510F8F|nr:uncharacterized protein LOC130612631 [Hydractinia symbiolongicarpus]